MMGVLNFAHASFYMLGAYFGYTLDESYLVFGLPWSLRHVLTGAAGALFESQVLRNVHKTGPCVRIAGDIWSCRTSSWSWCNSLWGRVAVEFNPPAFLQGPVFTLINHGQIGFVLGLWC
jgi:branched-chain amino acid transport system permease protein